MTVSPSGHHSSTHRAVHRTPLNTISNLGCVLSRLGQLDGAEAMALAAATPAEPIAGSRPKCDVLLFISSAAGYERRRATVRKTYLSLLAARPGLVAARSSRGTSLAT